MVDQRRETDAEPLIIEARSIYESLDAKPWLARADALTGATATAVPVSDG